MNIFIFISANAFMYVFFQYQTHQRAEVSAVVNKDNVSIKYA